MKYNLISADRSVSSFLRTVGESVNVQDLYEWIGEANEYLSVPSVLKQSLMFLTVEDYHADLPCNLKSILQIAKDNMPDEVLIPEEETTEDNTNDACATDGILLACDGSPLCEVPKAFYRPKPWFNPFPITYNQWINSQVYTKRFTPIRLATSTLFKSSVCKELDWENIYSSSIDQYTIVNEGLTNRKLRFTFPNGTVVISYLETNNQGVPLVIDNQSHLSAVQYYLLWKYSERMMLRGVQGSVGLNDRFQREWLRYCKQAKNEAMMPNLEQMDNIYQNTFKLLPSLKVFGNMFEDLNKEVQSSYILHKNLNY